MATQKGIEKWKAKLWFDVYAPKAVSTEVIGSVPSNDEKGMIGRVIAVSLSWITHNPNHSFMTMGMRVANVSGGNANTDVVYLEQQYSYLHSLVKRRANAIYTHDKVLDKDGKELTVKLLVTTKVAVAHKSVTAVRKGVSKFVKDYLAKTTKEDLIKAIIGGEFQSAGVKSLTGTAPIAKLEIKRVEF